MNENYISKKISNLHQLTADLLKENIQTLKELESEYGWSIENDSSRHTEFARRLDKKSPTELVEILFVDGDWKFTTNASLDFYELGLFRDYMKIREHILDM